MGVKSARRTLGTLAIVAALAAALFRPGRPTVETVYGQRVYPVVQASLTSLSNVEQCHRHDVG